MYNQLDLLIPEAILFYVVCETNKANEMILDFCISFISYTVQKLSNYLKSTSPYYDEALLSFLYFSLETGGQAGRHSVARHYLLGNCIHFPVVHSFSTCRDLRILNLAVVGRILNFSAEIC